MDWENSSWMPIIMAQSEDKWNELTNRAKLLMNTLPTLHNNICPICGNDIIRTGGNKEDRTNGFHSLCFRKPMKEWPPFIVNILEVNGHEEDKSE